MEDLIKKLSTSQTELAKRLGLSVQYVWKVLHGYKGVSPKRAMEFEKASGGEISRFDLRPDLKAFVE